VRVERIARITVSTLLIAMVAAQYITVLFVAPGTYYADEAHRRNAESRQAASTDVATRSRLVLDEEGALARSLQDKPSVRRKCADNDVDPRD
jgi:hypothetical protein